jgi:4-hydroxybutyryl-CoA dehydratase/vinylacetyl-CoA-Delta-isomerase
MAGSEKPSIAERGSDTFGCGESEFLMTHATIFASCHLWAKCMCRWANVDLSIGATGLIADYNGLEHAPHIQDCMSEMAMDAEVLYSCAVAAAVEGWEHESGVYVPRIAPLATGKVYSARKLGEHRYHMQDVAGGLVATMVSEKDYRSPETAELLEKYYKGREGELSGGERGRQRTGCGPSS